MRLLALLLAGCAAAPEPAGPPPIVLVSLDTLRADRLGAWGNGDGLTPSLDRFARESVVFDNAWAQSSQTLFSHASLFSGRYPSELGAVDYTFTFPDDVPTLAEVLRLYGYRTGAVVAGGHLAPVFGLDRGFDAYASPREWGSLYHTAPVALSWLDEGPAGAPAFLFVHGYDTHHRYLKPAPFGYAFTDAAYDGTAAQAVRRGPGTSRIADGWYFADQEFDLLFQNRFLRMRGQAAKDALARMAQVSDARPLTDRDVQHVRAVYDGAVAYADTMFGLLMAGLEERGLLDRAVVAVMSDHGEELGEHGIFNHRLSLSEEALKVPLMVRLPGGRNGGRVCHDLVSLLDVAPTLIEAAGATPPASLRGRSLWPIAVGGSPAPAPAAVFAEGVYREVSARTADGLVVFGGIAAHSPLLVDFLSTARIDGPAFVTTTTPEATGAIRDEMVAWRRSLPPSPAGGDAISADRLRILREGGYWTP